jgi:hypothetical protein
MVIGAGEGMIAAAFVSGHHTDPTTPDPVTFTYFGRAEIIGSTLGLGSGIAYGLLLRPTPKKTMLITSGTAWGAIVGYELGGGATTENFKTAKAGLSTGGLVGYNIGLAAAATTTAFWTPSWNQLAWMWGGFAVGEAAGALVYPIYAATGGDPRHGLIFQGIAGSVGAVAGAFLGHSDHAVAVAEEREDRAWMKHHHFARIRGGGLMPVPGGAGGTLSGELW